MDLRRRARAVLDFGGCEFELKIRQKMQQEIRICLIKTGIKDTNLAISS